MADFTNNTSLGGSGVIGGIIAGIGSALGTLFGGGSSVGGGLSALGGAVKSLGSWIADHLKALASAVWSALGKIVGALKSALIWFANHILGSLYNLIIKLKDALTRVLKPLTQWLEKVRKLVDRYWNIYVRPILRMIQRIRGFLQILKAFHVKWAAALDQRLAGIENAITKVYLKVRGTLNGVISALELILDTRGLLHGAGWILAAYRGITDLLALAHLAKRQYPHGWTPPGTAVVKRVYSAPNDPELTNYRKDFAARVADLARAEGVIRG